MLEWFLLASSKDFPPGVRWHLRSNPLKYMPFLHGQGVMCKNTLTFRVRLTRGSRSNGGAEANGYNIKWKVDYNSSDQTL